MQIGEAIRAAREGIGWSQSDLARRLGTDPSHVAHWESGRRDPSISNACALATVLGCSVDSLLGRNLSYDDGYRAGYFQCREDMKEATAVRLKSASFKETK